MNNTLTLSTPSDRELVITRHFDAPLRHVWDAVTKPELMRRWMFAPPGWEMTTCEEDQRAGGKFRWAWNTGGQQVMAMHGVYKEVSPPGPDAKSGRLVRTETFDFGCPAQAGEQLATMALTETAGKTKLTITVLYPSKEARDGAMCSGMDKGMAAGYDQLEQMLAAAASGAMQRA
jgi:uncharacterized protein YndB with AHSA1/START domain